MIKTMLSGGDRRSTGQSNKVVKLVAKQTDFDKLFKLISDPDPLVAMRAADAVEKITINHPEFLAIHKKEILEKLTKINQQEVRWHVAQIIPRLKLNESERKKIWGILIEWHGAEESNIVRVFSLQAIFDLAVDSLEWLHRLKILISRITADAPASIKARAKKIDKLLEKRLKEINFRYWQDDWGKEKEKWPASDFGQKTWKYIRDKNYRTLLDLGCGNGRDSIFFNDHGLKVTAMDISKSGIESLKRKNSQIRTILKDIKNINLPKNSFDVIYAHLSLQYFNLKESKIIFDKLHHLLTPAGMIFVRCKSIDDPKYGEGINLGENIFFKSHLRHFFTEELMKKLLKKFEIIKIEKTSHVRDGNVSRFIEGIGVNKLSKHIKRIKLSKQKNS